MGFEMAQKVEQLTSTKQKPYHYLGAGLPNVYLVGVKYTVDGATGEESVGIPRLPELLGALATALVEKRAPLTGDELRFLRKRLNVASKDFAPVVGVTAEQYSRLENGANLTASNDRLVRLLYAALARLPQAVAEGVALTEWTAELNHEERIIATQDEKKAWVVTTKAA
jgi:transcriptional regulator with XRE-family HTH domain